MSGMKRYVKYAAVCVVAALLLAGCSGTRTKGVRIGMDPAFQIDRARLTAVPAPNNGPAVPVASVDGNSERS